MPPLHKRPIPPRVLYTSEDLKDARCSQCKHLIFRFGGEIDVEVICHSCRRINYIGKNPLNEPALRGKDFQMKSIDHKCKKCSRLMLRSIGNGFVEKICEYCKTLTSYDTLLMRRGDQVFPVKDKTLGL